MAALKELSPYAVFIAQGSNPILPKSIPGIDRENVYLAEDILSGKAKIKNKKVAVVGSGMTGLETAHYLACAGNEVSVFEMLDDIGPGLFFQNLIDVMGHLNSFGAKFYPKHKLVEIGEDKVVFENTQTKEKSSHAFDYVVLSLGRTPNTELIDEIKSVFDNVIVLGDAQKAGKIRNAMESGFMAAYEL